MRTEKHRQAIGRAAPGPLQVEDLGRCPYRAAVRHQERRLEQRRRGAVADLLILVEHEPVYTLGRNAEREHVLADREALRRRGIEVACSSRGGDVTFHGPGQLVGYPIIDLRARGGGVLWYVDSLEAVLIAALADFGIRGERQAPHRGVWVGDRKIAALGVRVTHGVTMHGFALNVAVDLDYYSGIVPCGIADKGVTSMHLLVPEVAPDDVKPAVIRAFAATFGYREIEAAGETN